MKKPHRLHSFHLATLTFIFIYLSLLATSTSAADNSTEKFLPEKAKTVIEKFNAFQVLATPTEIETKRKQVIDYLNALLKQEAQKANLDSALAIRASIAQLLPPTAKDGLTPTEFSLGQVRRLDFNFHIAPDHVVKTIRISIDGASDDSGDLGLHYQLIDPTGKIVKSGFLNSHETELITHETKISGAWKIAFIDDDTETTGDFPGNNGSVQVEVTRANPSLASNRESP